MPLALLLLAFAAFALASGGASSSSSKKKMIVIDGGKKTPPVDVQSFGPPRVPTLIQDQVVRARSQGWFPLVPSSVSGAASALKVYADHWQALTGKRDPGTWARVFDSEVASADKGALANAETWSQVGAASDAYVDCADKFACPASKLRRLREDYVLGVDQWRRAGLMLVVKRGLQDSPAP